MTLADVAQSPVNELGRAARGSRREVIALDQQSPQSPRRRVPKHARAGDPATDHEHVEPLALCLRKRDLTLDERPAHSSLPGFIMPEGSTASLKACSARIPSTPFSAGIQEA